MRRLILSVGLSVGLILSGGQSLAQSKPAPAAAAAKTPAKPSAKQLELARRYFAAMHMEETMGKMLEAMDPLMMLGEEFEDESNKADRKAMIEATNEAMVAMTPKIVEGMIPVVASLFSEEELEAIVTFYESPAGQATILRSPEMMGPMSEVMLKLMPGYLTDVMDRYCAKVTCSDSLKDKIRKQSS